MAVIYSTEGDFRARKTVDPAVQAYYEIYTNRIYFYQTSDIDEQAPEVAALRRPQTVAHEGTHQILQNIGIQPRLATWPPWLVEGLAEYLRHAADHEPRHQLGRPGGGQPQHMATIRDLDEPLSGQVPGYDASRAHRPPAGDAAGRVPGDEAGADSYRLRRSPGQ